MSNIMIFIPSYGHMVSSVTFESTHLLVPMLQSKGHSVGVSTYSSPEIAEVRNLAVTHWFDGMKQSSHLLMIDADMGFKPEVVVDMLALNEPMVGAIYPKKSLQTEWAASGWGKNANAGGKGHFMKVRGLGMGLFLIRRDAIEIMVEKLPDVIDTCFDVPTQHPEGRLLRLFDSLRNESGHRMSEDLSFCYRWELCGGEMWGAGGYEMVHVGMHSFRGCYAKWADEKATADREKLAEAAE